jgi:hypothetical protein
LRIQLLFAVHYRYGDQPIGKLGRGFDRSFQPFFRAGLQRKTIYHDFYGVILALIERDFFIQRTQHAIHTRADKALSKELFEILLVFAFPATHDGRKNHDALAFRQREDLLQDLLGALARDFDATSGAMRNADG